MKKLSALLVGLALVGATTHAPAVVINEFMYNTEGGNYFVELYNRSGQSVDISGWQLWKSQSEGSDWDPVAIAKMPENTFLGVDGFYLIASQDVFVIAPDLEADFTLEDPIVTGEVEGIRLTDGQGGSAMSAGNWDTVLYGPTGMAPTGAMTDDDNQQAAARVIDVTALPLPKGGTVNISEMAGAGARREADDATLGDGSDGNGADTNNSAADFWGFETGSASPSSNATPVTLSIFTAK